MLKEENRYALKQNGVVIWLRRNIDELESKGRPLSKDLSALKKLEKERTPIYNSLADHKIEVDRDPEITLERILEKII
ncbi:MAG: hypothetical protein IJU45_04585 [Clostridia bacterium]|nr:hypothetical protein [Clostridia bacterium]